jgi:hypothetical protein
MSVCRNLVRGVVVLLAIAIVALPAAAASCDAPENRAFDFWVGTWEVHAPDGKLAGNNNVERQYGGCVIHEHYTTPRGYSGESLNIYDASRKVWHQTWVDTGGMLLLLEGGFRDGKMILEGQTANPGAAPTKHRITWSKNPDGSVRQLWESTGSKGQWTVAFDGKYTRK